MISHTMHKKHSVLKIYTDGGSRGNPGPSAIGVVLYGDDGEKVAEVSKYIGDATNNIAEYLAVVHGLIEAILLKAGHIVLCLDSQLVARHLKGEYKVKDKDLKKVYDIAVNLFRAFEKIEIVEIPREENKSADALVNRALDDKILL